MNSKYKRCPYCGEKILAVAKKCRYCGEWLDTNDMPGNPQQTESEEPEDYSEEEMDEIIASDLVEKERKSRRGNHYNSSAMHMIFGGNPGSAKTTVAKLFASIAKEKGILKSGASAVSSVVSSVSSVVSVWALETI